MSLDQNLFTLSLAASTEEPTALDLTDPSSNTVHYRKRRHPDQEKGEIAYAWGMYGERIPSPVPHEARRSSSMSPHLRPLQIPCPSRYSQL